MSQNVVEDDRQEQKASRSQGLNWDDQKDR